MRTTFVPTRRPIRPPHKKEFVKAKFVIHDRIFSYENSKPHTNKAFIISILFHFLIFSLQFPGVKIEPHKKEKIASIKMDFITPPESYKSIKKKAEQDLQKVSTKTSVGVTEISTNDLGKTGGPTQVLDQKMIKSKKGSAKAGPPSSPSASEASGLGNTANKGYEFKGKGLKALMGNSSTMVVAAGGNKEESRGLTSGTGIGNKGSNLSGDYRAPAGIGDGSGHLLGKDAIGNYDRSTTTHGLANKKGIDTAFVQADTIVMGSIEPEILRKILQEYLPQFKFCYQQELQEHSEKIKGIVDLNFRIEGDGKVSVVNIKSASAQFSTKGVSCMTNILKIIDFPKPKGGGLVDVRQPLNFYSESTKI